MQNFKILSLVCLLLVGQPALSNEVVSTVNTLEMPAAERSPWRAVFSRAGFFGKYALGFSYEITPSHAVDFSLGAYHMGDERYFQSNFAYRYTRWHVEVGSDEWRPLQYGIFIVHATGNNKYFFESPDVYPESNYYDATSIRYGLEVGSSYAFLPYGLAVSYHLRIFDTGLIALFNNSNRDLQYYISSGLSLQYLF